jgi:hypothetical protein
VKGTLSRGVLLDELIPLFREKKPAGKIFTLAEAEQFERAICDLPLQRLRVVRRIYGVMLPPGGSPVQMGDFTIGFGRQIFGPVKENSILAIGLGTGELDLLFIECTVEARDADRAVEMADALFYRFELIFRVFIGRRTERIEVGVLNYVGPQMRNRVVLSPGGGVTQGSSWEGALQTIPLDDPYFSAPAPPFTRLFQLISRENNDLEKHVLRCAEWTGQAIAEANAASAFVKAAIALEVLFSLNEKGIITPSIMAQIAEGCAFLLGNEQMSPLEIEREVKRLYGVRSSVVHSGKDSVDEEDLNWLIEICRKVLIALLTSKELAEIKSITMLAEHFRRKKYAFAEKAKAQVGA